MKVTRFIALLMVVPCFGQTNNVPVTPVARMEHAYKICDEGCTITSMPVGTVFQFGKDQTAYGQKNTWLPPETSTATYPALPFYLYYTDWPTNPTPSTKELDVQQTDKPQTITYTTHCSPAPCPDPTFTVVVPALAPVHPPPPATDPVIKFTVPPAAIPLGCWDGLVTSKDANGNPVQEYFYIICGNAPRTTPNVAAQ